MGQSPATIRDVARSAGLSVASVSRVLNGNNNVQPETKERVLRAVSMLDYTPNAAARSLSTARSHAIGVVLPDLHGEFFSELVRGMDKAASDHGYMLLLSTMHADSLLAGQAMAAMRGRVDGLIVMAPQMSAEELGNTLPAGLPIVTVNSHGRPGGHALRIDNATGVTAMVRHLLDSGRTRIVHISGMADNLDSVERREAYLAAMARFAPALPVRVLEGDFSEEAGERLTGQLLDEKGGVDAIFAANDMMALGALQALRKAGITTPGSVAVAGFDDIPLARYLSLTTVQVDAAGMGERAVARLVAEMKERSPAATTELLVTKLVVRETTLTP